MIIRRRHTANFTTIGNVLFEDSRLEADEVGVLAFLLSRPNDWEVRRPALQRRWRIGRDSIKRIITNCICAGWIVAKRTRLPNGTFHTVYEVRDQPGPTLTLEEVKAALSLVSSEAGDDPDVGDGPMTDHPPDSGPPPTPQPEVASQLRQTRRGSSKEELLNTDLTNTESTQSVRVFDDVLAGWPPEHVLSTVTSATTYAGLRDADKVRCLNGIASYIEDCRRQGRKICDLTTFIRERRWERFTRKPDAPSFFAVQPHTPQWHRWREYKIAIGQSVAFMDDLARQNKGVTERSEWPPAAPKKEPEPATHTGADPASDAELRDFDRI